MVSLKTTYLPSEKSDGFFHQVFQHIRYEHLVAGISGGLTSTLILHPLDLLKVRFAVHDGHSSTIPKYNGIFNGLNTIYKAEGVRGLYRGVTPNLWGSGSSWGLYFFFYNTLKTWMQRHDQGTPLGPVKHLLCASEAGVITLTITNPIWVIKTRLCLQYENISTNSLSKSQIYTGMWDALRKIYQKEGLRGLYKGYIPGIFGVSHGAIQFMTYEELKTYYNKHRGFSNNKKLGNAEYLTFAAVSKFVAVATTYPYQVVRARLQNQHSSYGGIGDCVMKTWRFEGWQGFYKGLGTNLLRVVPATMITFVTYENVSHFLMKN